MDILISTLLIINRYEMFAYSKGYQSEQSKEKYKKDWYIKRMLRL